MTGIVIRLYARGATVKNDCTAYECVLPLRVQSEQGRPAVGDRAVFVNRHGVYLIKEILPRKGYFGRTEPRPPFGLSVIAANIDAVVIMVTPPVKPRLIDRCLTAAARGGVQAIICVNKIDLWDAQQNERELAALAYHAKLGHSVIACSARTGAGLPELASLLRGKTAALVGHSGVGKSSLLNALNPSLELRTSQIRTPGGKGRHTTTAAAYYTLDGFNLIDTPGFREFDPGKLTADEWRRFFPEFAGHSCRFRDCTHVNEPFCGVRLAVRDGRIAEGRYQSYLKLISQSGRGEEQNEKVNRGEESGSFRCAACHTQVCLVNAGTEHRNHCPHCLCGMHLDRKPGDRAACCGGLMDPIAVWVRKGGEWALIHRCRECSHLNSNRIAADDNEILLLQLAVKPLAMPAFPLGRLGEMRDKTD